MVFLFNTFMVYLEHTLAIVSGFCRFEKYITIFHFMSFKEILMQKQISCVVETIDETQLIEEFNKKIVALICWSLET